MESEQEVQYEIKKDLNQMKEKKDWNFLSDIESLLKLNLEKKLRCIVFDTETTGIYHTKDHILELASIEIVNFELTGQIMHIYIEPRVNISKSAQKINNIKYDDYQNFWKYYNQDTKSQLQNLLNFLGDDSYLIAHNATFDYYFLMDELIYWELPKIPKERFRCTLRIAKKIFKSKGIEISNYKLETLCNYFKILVDPNKDKFHNGFFDAIMTSKLFINLYKNYVNINDSASLWGYQREKQIKEQKNDIIEKIDKINLSDSKYDIEQEFIDKINMKQYVEDFDKKKIDKKFDIKQEIIDCNKYLEKIDINAHSYLRYFKREEPPSEKEDINSLDELEKKIYNISKKINRVYEHCSRSKEFKYNFEKYQNYIDKVLKPKYKIQKIKTQIEIIQCINTGIDDYYVDCIDANDIYD